MALNAQHHSRAHLHTRRLRPLKADNTQIFIITYIAGLHFINRPLFRIVDAPISPRLTL